MIEVRDLTHRYGPLTAVEGLSFAVARGEVLGLLGPNGAGKTTTLRSVVGLLNPSAGSVRIGGHELAREPLAARRLLGFLPENVPLYRELTVSEFLAYAAKAKGVEAPRRAAELARVVEACGLAPVARRLIGFCSKGYRQRVGLAQALIGDPPALVLDEPTVGLDPAQVVEIRGTVAQLAREKAVILSTHVLPEASKLCSKVLILNRGHLVAEGTPDALERMLEGATRLRLVCGAATPCAPVLAAHAEVAAFAPLAAPAGQQAFSVDLKRAEGTPALIAALVGAGCAVHEVAPLRAGLEAVFLELVRREGEPAVAAASGEARP